MLTCKETAELVSKSMDQRISIWTRIKLKMHLKACSMCLKYSKQLQKIQEVLKKSSDQIWEFMDGSPTAMPEPVRARIKARVDESRKASQ